MKARVFRSIGDIYLAVLDDDHEMMRGGLPDLAIALQGYGITVSNLLFGGWRVSAELLSKPEQDELRRLMAEAQAAE